MAVENSEENGVPLLDVEAQKAMLEDERAYSEAPTITPTQDQIRAGARKKFLLWTAINMASTIGIVFTNKAIFNDPAFKLMQTSFASFHFVCTGLTLWVVSRPGIGAFIPKRAGIVEMLPVSTPFLVILYSPLTFTLTPPSLSLSLSPSLSSSSPS